MTSSPLPESAATQTRRAHASGCLDTRNSDRPEHSVSPRMPKPATLAGLLHLSTLCIWIAAAWRFYRLGHVLLASGLVLVSLLQLAFHVVGKWQQVSARHANHTFPRRKCAMPWHDLGVALAENEFNERVSVPVSPALHAARHTERAASRVDNKDH